MGAEKGRRVFLWALAALALIVPSCGYENPPGYKPSYDGARYVYKDRIQFDDGDTFLYEKRPIRILGIDCPEVADPEVGIYEDQPYGRAAAESTEALIKRAKRVELAPDGEDVYGRLLAHVFVDGELLAVKLIEMGLAYETVTHFGDNGFPDLAQRILDVSQESPKPPFEEPYRWRRKHQRRTRRR